MKNNFNHTFVHRALGAGLCVLMLSGMGISNAYAQAESGDTVLVRRIAKASRLKGPCFRMACLAYSEQVG